jgi:hypothetical protein
MSELSNFKVCWGRKKSLVRQVSNLHGPRETDFDSAVVTTSLRQLG